MAEYDLRAAGSGELGAVASLFNEGVLLGELTNDTAPRSEEQVRSWLTEGYASYASFLGEHAGRALGFAALSRHHPRRAYSPTAELTLYVRPEARGTALERALLERALESAERAGFHSLVMLVSGGAAWLAELARAGGFAELGRLHGVHPFAGERRDVLLFQKFLRGSGARPAP